jgi:hypothetical protein
MNGIPAALPPLHEDNQVPKIISPGQWERVEQSSFLSNIAHGLRVVKQDSNVEYLVSVPDVWARTEVVQSALGNPKHRLHRDIVAEWRGTLALIALEEFYKYSISASPINLIEAQSWPFIANTPGDQVPGRSFGDVLNDIKPAERLAVDQSWDDLALLRLDETPVALVVPTVLVCPRREIGKIFSGLVPWCKRGRLFSPCEAKGLQQEEFETLVVYLDSLISEVKNVEPHNVDVFQTLSSNLNKFLEECQAALGARAVTMQTHDGQSPVINRSAERMKGLPNHSIWNALGSIWRIESAQPDVFDTLLPPRPEFRDTINGAVIIDDGINESVNRAPQDIRLWKIYSLQRILESPELVSEIGDEMAEHGYLCLTPDDFFTEKICHVAEGGMAAHRSANLKNFLLPLSPLALVFMSPGELLKSLRIKKSGKGFAVSLTLSLQSTRGDNFEHVISKTYSKANVVNKEIPDSMTFWPDFASAKWKWYFFFYVGLLNIHFSPRMLFSAANVVTNLKSHSSSSDRMAAVRSLLNSGERMTRRLGLLETVAVHELHLLDDVPEAVFCDAALQSDISEYVPPSERTPLGLLVLPDAKPVEVRNYRWTLGIDFGTTNTSVYLRENDGSNRGMTFADRALVPFDDIDEETLDRALRDFFPRREVSIPFMSISRDRMLSVGNTEFLPVWNNYIYYVNNILHALGDIVSDRENSLSFNLKWSRRPEDRARVQLFLSQVVMQCLAEAAARGVKFENIEWCVSHPEAFTRKQLSAFMNTFASAIQLAQGQQGLEADEKVPLNIVRRTESLSTALYFISRAKAAFTENAVTIDIGGGTSDISIWQSRKLLWRSSVELAGRHIFIDFLAHNLDLLRSLAEQDPDLSEGLDQLEELAADDIEKRKYGIEVFVNSSAFKNVFDRIHLFDGLDSGALLWDVSIIALSGILFYVGRMVRHLTDVGVYETRGVPHMKICMGGRASLLFKTLFSDDLVDLEARQGVLEVFADATDNLINSASFVFSEDPKHEVAYGLLVETTGQANLSLDERSLDMIIGEELDVGGKSSSAETLISDLPTDRDWRINDFPSTTQLLDSIQRHLGVVVHLNSEVKSEISGRVNGELVGHRDQILEDSITNGTQIDSSMKGDSTVVEPVFVTVLRALVSAINEKKIRVESQ